MPKLALTFGQSMFLQLLVLLIGADLFIAYGLPNVIQALQPNLISHKSTITKYKDYLGKPIDPDVVIMGSSLVLSPAIHCDAAMLPASDPNKLKIRNQPTASYTNAKYFEGVLKDSYGKELSVYNLGLPGSMMGDNCAIFQEMLECKKRPSLIVLGLAARDFVNRKRVNPEKSKLIEDLALFHKENVTTVSDRLKNLPSTVTAHFDEDKEDLVLVKTLVNGKIADWRKNGFKTPEREPEEVITEIQLPSPRSLTLVDSMYAELFTDAQPEGVSDQLKYLDKMLGLANQANIPVVVVNLPVTTRHKNQLTDELTNTYQTGIKAVAQKNNCAFIDMDQPGEYDAATDFRDPIHLNAKGGRKFYKELVSNLVDRRVLTKSIATTPNVSN